ATSRRRNPRRALLLLLGDPLPERTSVGLRDLDRLGDGRLELRARRRRPDVTLADHHRPRLRLLVLAVGHSARLLARRGHRSPEELQRDVETAETHLVAGLLAPLEIAGELL